MCRHLESLQLLALAKLKDKDVEHLAALGSTLQVLSLKACNQVTTKAAPSIAQLTNLRKLDLSGTHWIQASKPFTCALQRA